MCKELSSIIAVFAILSGAELQKYIERTCSCEKSSSSFRWNLDRIQINFEAFPELNLQKSFALILVGFNLSYFAEIPKQA